MVLKVWQFPCNFDQQILILPNVSCYTYNYKHKDMYCNAGQRSNTFPLYLSVTNVMKNSPAVGTMSLK